MVENKNESKSKNKDLVKINNLNKLVSIVLVFGALFLSFKAIIYSMDGTPMIKSKSETEYVQDMSNSQEAETIAYESSNKTKREPIKVTEEVYSINILWYINIIVFVSFSLWGAFTVLLKALKFENEMNSKLMDVQKDIYKETEMWKLAKQKKEYESNTSKVSELNDSSKKDKEVQKKIDEFEGIEKVKLELKYKHELNLREKEIQALKEIIEQNSDRTTSEQTN